MVRSDRLTEEALRARLQPCVDKILPGHKGPAFVFIGPEDEIDAFDLQVVRLGASARHGSCNRSHNLSPRDPE